MTSPFLSSALSAGLVHCKVLSDSVHMQIARAKFVIRKVVLLELTRMTLIRVASCDHSSVSARTALGRKRQTELDSYEFPSDDSFYRAQTGADDSYYNSLLLLEQHRLLNADDHMATANVRSFSFSVQFSVRFSQYSGLGCCFSGRSYFTRETVHFQRVLLVCMKVRPLYCVQLKNNTFDPEIEPRPSIDVNCQVSRWNTLLGFCERAMHMYA